MINAVPVQVINDWTQTAFNHANKWRVELSRQWDALGPFPICAREQHYLSPSFPLNLTEQIDFSKTWPSSYADGGTISWSRLQAADNGDLTVSFPNIRWNALRATEGWAALQFHAILRTTLIIYPPQTVPADIPLLSVELKKGAFLTVIPFDNKCEGADSSVSIPVWYPGNIYDMERALPVVVTLPIPPSTTEPSRYHIFVSGDYEIRLFGDPRATGNEIPILNMSLTVEIEQSLNTVVRESTHDVVCDFVGGFAFGNAIGIGIRSTSGWWTLSGIELGQGEAEHFTLEVLHPIRLAPSQSRTVPIILSQTRPFYFDEIHVDLLLVSEVASKVLPVTLQINHVPLWIVPSSILLKASYFHAGWMPTHYLAIPPKHANFGDPHPPILALHGAGVDIIQHASWADSISRQNHSWIVLPTGRTSWGLDWHGPSAEDAWGSIDALANALEGNNLWYPWRLKKNTTVIVMGHSNGGQGSWYLGSRYPDRVVAVVAAAAYIKSQAYVPLTMSRSAHFIDPALRAILDSALTPDDNDLFLSNLIDTPVLAIHGGCDDNVPTWHTREVVSIMHYWQPDGNITLLEDELQPHWYPSVLDNINVQAFLDSILEFLHQEQRKSSSFTLTVASVAESGSLHGWRIESQVIPGRLSRLHVKDDNWIYRVTTNNVHSFSIRGHEIQELDIDGSIVSAVQNKDQILRFVASGIRNWTSIAVDHPVASKPHPPGRIQAILNSRGPFTIVIPQRAFTREFSAALRIAHCLNLYHKLDVHIIDSAEALDSAQAGNLGPSNVIVIGDASTPFVQWTLSARRTCFHIHNAALQMKGRLLIESGLGVLLMHPHPTVDDARMLFILATDALGLERAIRLFPVRTGISVPEWIIVGDAADAIGAAGVIGAGVWDRDWQWSREMSWLY